MKEPQLRDSFPRNTALNQIFVKKLLFQHKTNKSKKQLLQATHDSIPPQHSQPVQDTGLYQLTQLTFKI